VDAGVDTTSTRARSGREARTAAVTDVDVDATRSSIPCVTRFDDDEDDEWRSFPSTKYSTATSARVDQSRVRSVTIVGSINRQLL
jgi:hypothetical protein